MPTLPTMLERMYALSVWDTEGKQQLPIFDYNWRDVVSYLPAAQAISLNTTNWLIENQKDS